MLSDKNVDVRGQKRIPEQTEESKRSPLFLYTNELWQKRQCFLTKTYTWTKFYPTELDEIVIEHSEKRHNT